MVAGGGTGLTPPSFGSIHDSPDDSPPPDEQAELAALRRARIGEATANLAQFKSLAPGVDAQVGRN